MFNTRYQCSRLCPSSTTLSLWRTFIWDYNSKHNCASYVMICIPPHVCSILNHIPLVPHICVSESGQYWLRWWLVAYSAPSHHKNQCWVIVNWTLRNKFQWNVLKIQNFPFMNMHLKISSVTWRPFCLGGDELTTDYALYVTTHAILFTLVYGDKAK